MESPGVKQRMETHNTRMKKYRMPDNTPPRLIDNLESRLKNFVVKHRKISFSDYHHYKDLGAERKLSDDSSTEE